MSTAGLLSIALCGGVIATLRPHARAPRSLTRGRLLLLKLAVVARSFAASWVVWLLLLELLAYAARLPAPRNWAVWAPGLLAGLLWMSNAAAGLWCLPWLATSDVALGIVAAGHRGRILRYGLARLTLLTGSGWLVQVPYLALLHRPPAVRAADHRERLTLHFQRQHWTDEEFARLRQAAVLSPYRDVTVPARISRRAGCVTVEISASRDAAEVHLREALEQLVVGLDAAPARAPRDED